jgi:hypothetical protein
MDNENRMEPINLLLSREELLFALNLLEAQFIPGLDPDPLGELTAEQRPLALTVAGRALRARELAQVQENGEWLLHNDLLTAIGGCAYAQSLISVYHWSPTADTPARYFGHIRGNNIVAHTRPEDVLHRFTLLPSREQLASQVLAFCGYDNGAASPTLELSLPAAALGQVRELAVAGERAKAEETLAEHSVAPDTAKAFVDILAASPKISILQTLKQQEEGAVQKQDLTLLQNDHQAWLIIAFPETMQVKTVTKSELEALLTESL